jgi:glutamate racemase
MYFEIYNTLSFVAYLFNRTHTSANEYKTSIQVLSAHINIASILQLPPIIFGCTAYVHIQKSFRNKLESRIENAYFLG